MHLAVLSGFIVSLAAPSLHRFTRNLTGWILSLLPVSLFIYFATFIPVVAGGESLTFSYPWIPSLGISLSFTLDGLSLLFALLICGIGALVTIYASGYLAGHPLLGRFYAFLVLFMASMLGTVLASNVLLLFVFWELTSISSYLLIGFEHEREEARRAALQALLVTSAGGLAMLAGFVLLGQSGGTMDLSVLGAHADVLRAHQLYLPALLLILAGAFTKSAQFPFHFWLPGAMEAPTPVSAYLHSATMVKAGIYLLARLSPILGGTDAWFYLIAGAGLVTLLFSAFLALISTNLKRILAYTTISSLGVMTMLIGIGTPGAIQAMVVFLLAHALYKGALFMIAGAIYHETGTQEVDELGGLRAKMPLLTAITLLAGLSLASFGPLLSFIGKEQLLEALLEMADYRIPLTAAVVVFSTVSVAMAMILFVRPFFGALKPTPKQPHEPALSLWLGPAVLALSGLVLGIFPSGVAHGLVSPAVSGILGTPQAVSLKLWHGFTPALGLSLLSVLLGVVLFLTQRVWFGRMVRTADRFAWLPEKGYSAGLNGLLNFASRLTSRLQTGRLHDYLQIVAAAAVVLVTFTLIIKGERIQIAGLPEFTFFEAALTVVILAAAFVVTATDSRLFAVAALGVVGAGVSLIFIIFGAPDLAMTQFLIETVTVILLVLILYHLPNFARLTRRGARIRDSIVAISAGVLMTVLVLIAHTVNFYPPISDYYLDNSVVLGHGRNIVNVILVDFRGLDTMGEITVLSLAALGVFALLKLRKPDEERRP
ncbi:MAG: putative monovalent cation/H+ antiporter subunit A [Chloroflexi bacterium]|jgi:multicomponent Na+:H+ antiporter subunit A|nr:putative monovalent cation/H+ antiporter subunit A [Chloroflexota bacterium]